MKVLIVNTSENNGGAAIAAHRLYESLNQSGTDARMMVLHKDTQDEKVTGIGGRFGKKYTFIKERVVIWMTNLFSRKNLFSVSTADSGFDITHTEAFRQADIIHLHWINQGLLSLHSIQKILRSGKPVVWTMHDMWECTGICHHAYTCARFKEECRVCPFLRFPGRHDLSNRIFKRKQRIYRNTDLHIVTVSNWLARQVEQSALLKDKEITVIPNTLSLSRFRITARTEARKQLSLPEDKHILLFGAARIDDPIKGIHILLEALRHLTKKNGFRPEELHLVLFGRIKDPESVFPLIPIPYTYMGWVSAPDKQALLYSAANLTVSASLYETFGQTLIEAQACGCLPVSFGNSGQADIIRHKENGFIAEYRSAESLADGMAWGLTEGQNETLKAAARASVIERYSGEIISERYTNLYEHLLNRQKNEG